MDNIIAKIWQGNLAPARHCGEHNPEIKQLEKLMQLNFETLEEYLSGPAKKMFEKYHVCVEEYILASCEQVFHDGFCLVTKITAEALTRAEKIV